MCLSSAFVFQPSPHLTPHTTLHQRAGGSHGFANVQPPLSFTDRSVQEGLCTDSVELHLQSYVEDAPFCIELISC